MPIHLLDLPTELLEHILVLLCHTNAQSIQSCRQTCHALNETVAQSKLVQYLEHLALLGLYDPLLIGGGSSSSSSSNAASAPGSLALPERASALRAWEEAWSSLAGGGVGNHDSDAPPGVFWQQRKPDLRIAHPPPPPPRWPSSSLSHGPHPHSPSPAPRVKYILANILEPDPPLDYQLAASTAEGQHGFLDEEDRFSFGPWFVAATRDGLNVRASYSYLDLHGCLGDVGGDGGFRDRDGDGDVGDEYDRVHWTVIKIPLWDVVAFVLSTELDLTVVISILKIEGQYQEEEGERRRKTTTHLVLRPLCFRDGTPHPCAKVPVMRLCVKGDTVFHWTQAQVLGDYMLLWIGPGQVDDSLDYSLSKLYLVAWKIGSITLLRDFPLRMYGAIPAMISKDVLALVQLDPPGIELCRISNMGKEVEDEAAGEGGGEGGGTSGDRDSGATKDNSRGRSDGRPRMDKLCTLLLPPLRQERDGSGARTHARVIWAVCLGEHPGHQTFSRGPSPEYRRTPLGRRHMFRQSTKDSIVSVVMQIEGCGGGSRSFEFVVRCATLLAYADAARVVVPTAAVTGAAGSEASNSDGGASDRSASVQAEAQAQVMAGDINAEGGVPWAGWGPRATALSDQTHVGWKYLLGERRATIEEGVHRIRIRDYNPYRIRQAKASMVAKGLGRHEQRDSHEHEGEDSSDEGEGIVDPFHPHGTRRITESRTTRAEAWFEEDVRTALPHLEVEVDVPGCREIYMEQDQVLVRVDDLDKITGRPKCMNGHDDGRDVEGFVLYSM